MSWVFSSPVDALHPEAVQVAVVGVHALLGPRARQSRQVPAADPIIAFHARTELRGIEQSQGRLEQRTALARVAVHQNVDGVLLHQALERDGQRALGAAHGAEQIQHLLALLEALGGVPVEGDDLLDDAAFHAVELGEGIVIFQGAVAVQAQQAGIGLGLDQARLADGLQDALGGERVGHGVIAAQRQIFGQGERRGDALLIRCLEVLE